MGRRRGRGADPEDRLAVAEAGMVAPALGFRARGAGRAAWAHPGRAYVATTTQAAGLYPFLAGSGAPTAGVPLGPHALWGETVCLDPFAWMAAGLVTNTGMFLLGQPGVGKSALAKRLTLAMPAFGVRPIILGDTKGEHTAIITALGGQVIRVGRGLDRINPLDAGPLGSAADLLPADRAAQVALEVRGRRLTSLLALCALIRGTGGAPVSNGEEVLLGRSLDLLVGAGKPNPTVPDVLRLLKAGGAQLAAAAQTRTQRDYETRTRELVHTLELLLTGSLAGVFDGPTTHPIDLSAPGVSVDISATAAAGDTLVAAAMLSTWSYGFGAVDAAALLADAGLATPRRHFLVMDELWRALRGAPGLVDHADALTRLNRARGIASLMITHSLADLEALPTPADVAKARGFVDRAAIVVLGGLPRRELDAVSAVVPMTPGEATLVAGWSAADSWQPGVAHPGRGRYLIKTGARPGLVVSMELMAVEHDLYDTDTRVRQVRP